VEPIRVITGVEPMDQLLLMLIIPKREMIPAKKRKQ